MYNYNINRKEGYHMDKIMKLKQLLASRNYIRTLPVYLCIKCSDQRRLVEMDIARWNQIEGVNMGFFKALNWHLTESKQFRNLLQHRMRNPSRTPKAWMHFFVARMLWKPLDSLYLKTTEIGGGLYLQHGFSTIVSAKKIGENCRIYQQVTVGYKETENPVLGDYVSVACGAKVLGGITMHNYSLAAAGSVVVKDVPENAIVGGVPAKIIGYKDPGNLTFQG